MNGNVAVTEPRVEPITHPRDQLISVHPRSSAAKIFLPAALAPRVRRVAWMHAYERVHGSDALVGAPGSGKAPGSRFKGSVRDGLNGTVGSGVGALCGERLAEGAGRKATGSVGAVEVGAARGIAGFLAVCLTDMVGGPNRRNKASRSAATARSAPWLQRPGGGAVTFLHPIALTRWLRLPAGPSGDDTGPSLWHPGRRGGWRRG
jgi:hypothetical protein